jgi:hypothetical protein
VPPFTAQVDFVFNRRLDGDRIEDTVQVDGGTVTRPKASPPVTVELPATVAAAPPPLDVVYNSQGIYGVETSYVIARPHPAGFPAGATVTFHLDRASLTSPYDEPLAMPDSLAVTTQPFTVAIRGAGADGGVPTGVATDFRVPLDFTNRPGDVTALGGFVHARAGGVDLPVALAPEAGTPTTLYLVPAACLGAWPANSTIEVTVDAGLPDAFGVGLVAGASLTFATGAGPVQASDACPAGGGDGGA